MRNAYAIARVKELYDAPFTMSLRLRVWGTQWTINAAGGLSALAPSLCGNSKQRRQQRREILRALNEV